MWKGFLKKEESDRKNLKWHVSKITDNVEEIRNLLDTIPGQDKKRNRLKEQLQQKPYYNVKTTL